MKKRIISLLIVVMMIVSLSSTTTLAASGKMKTMTAYTVVKKGNTVYCNGWNGHIYKVDLTTKNVKKIANGDWTLRIHNGYLYYTSAWKLNRLKLSTGKKETLYKISTKNDRLINYAIKGKKIYVNYLTSFDKTKKKVMNLNGKKKKASKYKVKNKYKTSNVAGYKLDQEDFFYDEEEEDYAYSILYLITPEDKIEVIRGYDDGEGIDN